MSFSFKKGFIGLAVFASSYMYAISLEKTLGEVLVTHPDILEKQKSYNGAIYDIKSTHSEYYPTIVFEAQGGHQNKKDSSTTYKNEDSSYYEARLTARQNIYDGGRVSAQKSIKKSLAFSSLYSYLRVSNNIAFEAIKAYINVLKLHELKTLSVENVKIHENLLSSVKLRMKSGKQGRSELERVLGRLSAAKTKMILRKSEYEKSLYMLHKVLGRFVRYEDMVKPIFDDSSLPLTLKEAFLKQIASHPAYKEGEYMLKQRHQEHEREQKEKNGKLYLEASGKVSDESKKQDENEIYVALRYDHTLYDGGKRENKIQRARSIIHEEQQKQNGIRRTLTNDLELTWSSYKLLYSQIGEMKKSLYFTKKALQTYKEEFRIGRRLLITILDAQNEYQNALDQLISMEHDLLGEKYRVLYSQGTLLEDLGLLTSATKALLEKDAKDEKVMSEDVLPLNYDMDKDGVKDPYDLSTNSIPQELVNSLGMNKEIMKENKFDESLAKESVEKIRIIKDKQDMIDEPLVGGVLAVFDFVSFKPKSMELSGSSKDTMRYLIEQLKNYSSEGVLFVTVGTDEFEDEYLDYKLAMKRAYNFKRILQNHNIESDSISVFADTKPKNSKSYIGIKIVNSNEDYKKQYIVHETKRSIFKSKSTNLNEFASEFIKSLATQIERNRAEKIDLVVYSNDFESPIENRNLSITRAATLRDAIIQSGINEKKIVSFGWGQYKDRDFLMGDEEENYSKVEYILRDE